MCGEFRDNHFIKGGQSNGLRAHGNRGYTIDGGHGIAAVMPATGFLAIGCTCKHFLPQLKQRVTMVGMVGQVDHGLG